MGKTKPCVICEAPIPKGMKNACSDKCYNKHKSNLKKAKELKVKEKKQKKVLKKQLSRSKLIKEADRVWSLFIRDRDRGKPCITCGAEWQDNFQAGHFQSRRFINTRFVDLNGASQCPKCNLWGSGEQYEFGLALDKKSHGLSEELRKLAHSNDVLENNEIIEYIRLYYKLLGEQGYNKDYIKPKKYLL